MYIYVYAITGVKSEQCGKKKKKVHGDDLQEVQGTKYGEVKSVHIGVCISDKDRSENKPGQ